MKMSSLLPFVLGGLFAMSSERDPLQAIWSIEGDRETCSNTKDAHTTALAL